MIYLLNADRGTYDSVKPLVEAGRVEHLPCPTFPDFQAHAERLMKQVKYNEKDGTVVPHDDLLILDTLTRMADTARGDMKIGVEAFGLWERREIFYKGDTFNYGAYEAASQLTMRTMRNLANRGYRIIVICHEDEQFDDVEGSKKRGPDLNKALWSSLRGTSTDIYRLTILDSDILKEDGGVAVPAGTRVLQTFKDETAICKYQAAPSIDGTFRKVPKYIYQPSMRKIEKVMGKKPTFLTLYGEPGAGKTTLAVSEAFDEKAK